MHRFHDALSLRTGQYRDGANLAARIRLHRDFTTASVPWDTWVFDRLVARTPDTAAVLEVGAGTGALWTHNYDRLPMAWWVWLTDFSPGMVRELRHALDGAPQVTVTEADARALPLGDGSFDSLLANHMLYHLPEPGDVLDELARVLRPGGTLLAATNGGRHLAELRDLVTSRVTGPAPAWPELTFDLDSGGRLLADRYTRVRLERYDDELRVTDADAVVRYLSSGEDERLTADHLADVRAEVEAAIDRDGAFVVTKDVGLFVATAG